MEIILGAIVVSLVVVIFLLLWSLERQRVLHKRVVRLEDVLKQAVGPNLAQRLTEGGTKFSIPDREWIEDEIATE